MKKLLLLSLISLFGISCDTEIQEINSKQKNISLPIELVNLNNNTTNRIKFENVVEAVIYDLATLNSSCDVSNIGFESFTNSTNFNDYFTSPNSYFNLNGTPNANYSEFPTNYITKGLTHIFSNPNFLPMPIMSPGQINPITGQEYYVTRVNNYYTEYIFINHSNGIDPISSNPIYSFLSDNISSIKSNQIRNLIACQIIQEANNIDPTAFILDIGVDDDSLLCTNCNDRMIKVWIKWAYNR